MLVRKFEFLNDVTGARTILVDDPSVKYKSPPEGFRFLRKWVGEEGVINVVKEVRKSDSIFVNTICQKSGYRKLKDLNKAI